MMKRTRVDEVQYGTRPGPGGVGGSGGGGGAVGGGSAGGNAVNIGPVGPGAHGSNIAVGIGSGGIGAGGPITHHRILSTQHGGAQTIAYLPSTTPASNMKATSNVTGDGSVGVGGAGAVNTIGGGGGGGIPQIGSGTVVSTGGAGAVVQSQPVQYSTCEYKKYLGIVWVYKLSTEIKLNFVLKKNKTNYAEVCSWF